MAVARQNGVARREALLDAAHARGIRVVLDGVFNHVGRGFWPFHHLLESGGASPYRAFVSLPGHEFDVFNSPQYRVVLLRGIA